MFILTWALVKFQKNTPNTSREPCDAASASNGTPHEPDRICFVAEGLSVPNGRGRRAESQKNTHVASSRLSHRSWIMCHFQPFDITRAANYHRNNLFAPSSIGMTANLNSRLVCLRGRCSSAVNSSRGTGAKVRSDQSDSGKPASDLTVLSPSERPSALSRLPPWAGSPSEIFLSV